jgi:alpha-ketoglutarate-dependent taurine dioxygenase
MDERYCYYHSWSEGDLLLLDNKRTLHGREAFKGQRSLANIQVIAA